MHPTVFTTRPKGRAPFYAIKIDGHKWHLGIDAEPRGVCKRDR